MAKEKSGAATVRIVEEIVRPVVEDLGLRLWDVRFEKEGPDWYLRILIERDTPLDTDTCEDVTRAIDPLLDEADPIEQSYYLEVGSPGLGRRLTRDEHFARYLGEKVAVRLIRPDENGNRDYEGELKAFENGNVTVMTPGGEVTVPLAAASYVKLCDDEDLF